MRTPDRAWLAPADNSKCIRIAGLTGASYGQYWRYVYSAAEWQSAMNRVFTGINIYVLTTEVGTL